MWHRASFLLITPEEQISAEYAEVRSDEGQAHGGSAHGGRRPAPSPRMRAQRAAGPEPMCVLALNALPIRFPTILCSPVLFIAGFYPTSRCVVQNVWHKRSFMLRVDVLRPRNLTREGPRIGIIRVAGPWSAPDTPWLSISLCCLCLVLSFPVAGFWNPDGTALGKSNARSVEGYSVRLDMALQPSQAAARRKSALR